MWKPSHRPHLLIPSIAFKCPRTLTDTGDDMSTHSQAVDNLAAAPGVYSMTGAHQGQALRYWDGTTWDPRPVAQTWTRVWCNGVDLVIAGILWIFLSLLIFVPVGLLVPAPAPGDNDPVLSFLGISVFIIAFVGYFALSYRLWGRTLGMMLGKLWVVHIPTGSSRLPWGTSIARAIGLCLGYLLGIMTLIWLIVTASSRTKQGPHDSMANTCVLRGPRPPAPLTVLPTATGGTPAVPGTTAVSDAPSAGATVAASGHQVYRRKSRAPVITGVVAGTVALALVLIVGAVWVDSRIRTNTMNELLDAVEAAEQINVDYIQDPRWAEQSERWQAARSLPGRPEQYYRDAWRTFVNDTTSTAGEYVAPMQRAILDIEAVSPLPWHGDIAQARDAYLEHALVWQDVIDRRTKHTTNQQSVPNIFENLDANISRTWERAERRLRDISYPWMPREVALRIDQVIRAGSSV